MEHEQAGPDASRPEGWVLPEPDYPTFRLSLVAKYMDRMTIRQLAELSDLSYAEWRVLSRLALMPDGGTVGRIAGLAWVDRAEVSRAASSLEKRGMVSRRDNSADRRTPILSLTESGVAEQHRIMTARGQFHEALMQDLTAEDRARLDELLQRIATRVLSMMPGRTED